MEFYLVLIRKTFLRCVAFCRFVHRHFPLIMYRKQLVLLIS